MNWKDRTGTVALMTALAGAIAFAAPAFADDVTPPPPSVGTNVPASYFGPFPSQIDRKLVGPVQLLRSGTLDAKKATIKIPLYLGHMTDGRNVWYILTDTSDKENADALGPKLFVPIREQRVRTSTSSPIRSSERKSISTRARMNAIRSPSTPIRDSSRYVE